MNEWIEVRKVQGRKPLGVGGAISQENYWTLSGGDLNFDFFLEIALFPSDGRYGIKAKSAIGASGAEANNARIVWYDKIDCPIPLECFENMANVTSNLCRLVCQVPLPPKAHRV